MTIPAECRPGKSNGSSPLLRLLQQTTDQRNDARSKISSLGLEVRRCSNIEEEGVYEKGV
jgi:hypothetical protein